MRLLAEWTRHGQRLRPAPRTSDMNILRRVQVVSGVVAATAAVGAVSGMIVASALLTMRIGHIRPSLLWELAALGSQTGAVVGVVLGAPLTLGLLRRVPLRRIAADVFASATYGGIVGYALSLGFAQPRPSVPLMLAGSCVGVAMASAQLCAKFRGGRTGAAIPSAG
jgi:hypothetical protein